MARNHASAEICDENRGSVSEMSLYKLVSSQTTGSPGKLFRSSRPEAQPFTGFLGRVEQLVYARER
jgi:hypothetical protein